MKLKTSNIILAALFSALTIVGAKINFLFPEIPVTLQPVIVILAGSLIGSRAALLSQIVYLTLGLIGIPVFAKPIAGPSYVLQPTFGYLLGFIVSAFVIGFIIERNKNKSLFTFALASIIGLFIIYIFGISYFYFLMNYFIGKMIGITGAVIMMFPYMIKDLILGLVTSSLAYEIYRRVKYNSKEGK